MRYQTVRVWGWLRNLFASLDETPRVEIRKRLWEKALKERRLYARKAD